MRLKIKHRGICRLNLRHRPEELSFDQLANGNTIKGVEIFATGKHNGHEFTEDDIDEIIKAFQELDVRPALKIGHTKPPRGKKEVGMPAFGYVTNLTKQVFEEGGKRVAKLLADFESMHDSVANAIRTKMYDRVSSEIYLNLERGGKFFKRALKAVALLGAEWPAVAKLQPLHKIEFSEEDAELAFSEVELDVSREASIASLEGRITATEAFLSLIEQEPSMIKKHGSKIKQLKADLEEFNQALVELKKAGKKADDPEMKRLKKCAETLESRIAELEEQEGGDDKDAVIEAQDKRIKSLEAKGRKAEVAQRAGQVKLAAVRPIVAALYTLGLENDEVQVDFSTTENGKTKTEQVSIIELTDQLVEHLNKKVEPLLKIHANTGNGERQEGHEGGDDDDVQLEVDAAVEKLRAEKPGVFKTYSEAMRVVFKANPDLKQRYNTQSFSGDPRKESVRTH